MANVFQRSWEVTKLSFSVINKDKELIMFPLLSGFFSLIFIILMIFPFLFSVLFKGTAFETGYLFYLSVFVIYFGLAFIATFFNVCVVYTTKIRFEGGNATFMDSIKFAFSKAYLIFLWSLVSASVGLLLRLLEQLAEKFGKTGEMIMNILISLLGMAWSIVTLFVIPSLVYDNLTPGKAIKKSAATLKKTWGESLIRYYGLGLTEFLLFILGIAVFIGLFLMLGGLGIYVILVLALLAIIYFLGLILVFNVANTVYNTALFVYADSGKIPSGFNKDVIEHSFEKREN